VAPTYMTTIEACLCTFRFRRLEN